MRFCDSQSVPTLRGRPTRSLASFALHRRVWVTLSVWPRSLASRNVSWRSDVRVYQLALLHAERNNRHEQILTTMRVDRMHLVEAHQEDTVCNFASHANELEQFFSSFIGGLLPQRS